MDTCYGYTSYIYDTINEVVYVSSIYFYAQYGTVDDLALMGADNQQYTTITAEIADPDEWVVNGATFRFENGSFDTGVNYKVQLSLQCYNADEYAYWMWLTTSDTGDFEDWTSYPGGIGEIGVQNRTDFEFDMPSCPEGEFWLKQYGCANDTDGWEMRIWYIRLVPILT